VSSAATPVQASYTGSGCNVLVLYSNGNGTGATGPSGIVSTSGTAVTWQGGNVFNANGQWAGLAITIAGTPYTVSSCGSSSSCTLTSSAGTQTGAAYSMSSSTPAAIFSDNAGTAKSNPFSVSSAGYWFYYADNGSYANQYSGTAITNTFTNAALPLSDPSNLPNVIRWNSTLGTTFAQQCAAASIAPYTAIVVDTLAPVATTFTASCSIIVNPGGVIQPASGQTVTFSVVSAPLATICDMSLGGLCIVSSASGIIYPEWFNSATPIQSAVTAANGASWVLIPTAYAGSDTYLASGNKNVIDLRLSGLGVYQYVLPAHGITGYPLGNDLALEADGPADLLLLHGDHGTAVTTTATSINPGTQNITVVSTANFSTTAGYVHVDYQQPAFESCTLNSITPPTTMNITCAGSHSGTVTVDQTGTTQLNGHFGMEYNAWCPASAPANDHCPTFLGTQYQNTFAWPAASSDTFPLNAFQISAPITGMTSGAYPTGPADLVIRNASSGNKLNIETSTGSSALNVTDTGVNIFLGAGGQNILNINGTISSTALGGVGTQSSEVAPNGNFAKAIMADNAGRALAVMSQSYLPTTNGATFLNFGTQVAYATVVNGGTPVGHPYGMPYGVDVGYGIGTNFTGLSAFPYSSSNNGAMVYCSDCKNVVDNSAVAGAECSGSGSGSVARRQSGHWDCN